MELISYCICVSLLLCGCLPGMWRAKQVIEGTLHSFECGHLVGEFFLQILFTSGVVIYLFAAQTHGRHAVIATIVLATTAIYLFAGLFLVTSENQEDEAPKTPDHSIYGWPLLVFHLARLATMLTLITLSLK